ncbi:hypothetical protein [Bacillus sp. FJAT-29937]|uniref:hypothetical protein n=1 Tax=Bacillus sp. FJAT-29937 TaxID=1720553 RepID=UPI000830C27D|nr:hypothetical protein [Bacillus sp. FJAT-29937]
MSRVDKVWDQIMEFPEPNNDRMLTIFNELIFSSKTKFKDIRDLVERVDLETFRLAIHEIESIPPMEVSEEEDEDESRYSLYGNYFRERYLMPNIMEIIWGKAKPKNKKNFF